MCDCTKMTISPKMWSSFSVESAVLGIIEVIKTGASGSVWKVADDEPAQDISQHVKKGFTVFSSVVKK